MMVIYVSYYSSGIYTIVLYRSYIAINKDKNRGTMYVPSLSLKYDGLYVGCQNHRKKHSEDGQVRRGAYQKTVELVKLS